MINFGEWEVKIEPRYDIGTNFIFLVKKNGHERQLLTKDGVIIMLKEGGRPQPDVALHFAELDDDQLKAFADALATFGIKTKNDSKNEGLLEATRYHLEDMRRLAFEKRGVR